MIHRQHPFFLTWLGRHTYLLNKFLLSYGLLYDTFHFSSSDNSWSHRVSLLVVSQCSTRSCGKSLIPSIFSHTRPCFSQKWPWAFHHRCPYLSLADTQGRYLAKFKGELSNALRYLDTGSLHMCLNPDRSLYTEGELVQRCYLKSCNPCRDKMKKEKNPPPAPASAASTTRSWACAPRAPFCPTGSCCLENLKKSCHTHSSSLHCTDLVGF